MIKDITIGQYFPGNSVIHRMDARIKIIMTAVFIVMLFAANSVWGLLVGIVFTILTFIISKIPGKLIMIKWCKTAGHTWLIIHSTRL